MVIVGAGPSGLLLALLLAKQGIEVQVFEAENNLNDQTRATHYAPPAMHELRRAGVFGDVMAAGFVPSGVSWREIDGMVIAERDASRVPAEYPSKVICLPLNQLLRVLLKHVQGRSTAEVKFGHRVVGLHSLAAMLGRYRLI